MRATDRPVIETIIDLDRFESPLSMLLPAARVALLEPWRGLFGGDHFDYARGVLLLAIQSHVVRVGGATILLDACLGEHKDRPQRSDWHQRTGTDYMEKLARVGCRPEDIDIVMCTHLHADHVGWNTRLENGRWIPTFPNARYIVGAGELAYWQAEAAQSPGVNHGSYQDSVLPILEAGMMGTVAAHDEITDGASIVPLPGHSAGQIGLQVSQAEGPDILFCGDAIHSPVQVPYPEWASFVCFDPAEAIATREKILERAASSDLVIAPAHLRAAFGMRIKREGARHSPVFCDCAGRPI